MKYTIITLLAFFIACKPSPVQNIDPLYEEVLKVSGSAIDTLASEESKKKFLVDIYRLDQISERDVKTALEYYGNGSQIHNEKAMVYEDAKSRNAARIVTYLQQYEYPQASVFGEIAANTPGLIIANYDDLNVKMSLASKFAEAHKNKNLNSFVYVKFLNSAYRLKYGKSIELKSPFTEEKEIESLIKALDL